MDSVIREGTLGSGGRARKELNVCEELSKFRDFAQVDSRGFRGNFWVMGSVERMWNAFKFREARMISVK